MEDRRVKQSAALCIAAALALLLAACDGLRKEQSGGLQTPERRIQGNAARGHELILNYGCGACHTIPGVVGANSTVGPSLDGLALRRVIAGDLVNTQDNLVSWLQDPAALHANTTMPDMGVTASDAQDIAAYLYTLD
jgi:cytochrome c